MTSLTVYKDLVFFFGDRDDGVIGIPAITQANNQIVESSYFFGKTKPKNIINISSQVGCPMQCTFCELGSEKFARNLTAQEMYDQVLLILDQARAYGFTLENTAHKVTVANSGEPLLNPQLIDGLGLLAKLPVSLKISTVFPRAPVCAKMFGQLAEFASTFHEPLQIQISLISTSEEERMRVSGGHVASFQMIREAAEVWFKKNPTGRKVNLSLILTSDMSCNVDDVVHIFPPKLFRFRFREYVPTRNGTNNRLSLVPSMRLSQVKNAFAEKEYEVGDWASPSHTEWKFGLAGNTIRRMYFDIVQGRGLFSGIPI